MDINKMKDMLDQIAKFKEMADEANKNQMIMVDLLQKLLDIGLTDEAKLLIRQALISIKVEEVHYL